MHVPLRAGARNFSLVVFSLFALTACYVYPDNGKWAGVGSYNDEGANDHRACNFNLEITHISDTVAVDSLQASCGGRLLASLKPGSFKREGERVMSNGNQIGRIYADGTVEIDVYAANLFQRHPYANSRVVIAWTHMGEQLHFSVREGDGPRTRRFDGWLRREST